MKGFLRYLSIITFAAITIYTNIFLSIEMTKFIEGGIDDFRIAIIATLLTVFTLTTLIIIGGRIVFHRARRTQAKTGTLLYIFTLCLNMVMLWITGSIITHIFYISIEHFAPLRDGYITFLRRFGFLDSGSQEDVEDATSLFTFILCCAVASPLVWMITKRFRLSAL